MAISLCSPIIQEFIQRHSSTEAHALWGFALLQEQLRTSQEIIKELSDHINNISSTHNLLRLAYDHAQEKIRILESSIFNDNNNRYTEFSKRSTELDEAQEKIKKLEGDIIYIKAK